MKKVIRLQSYRQNLGELAAIVAKELGHTKLESTVRYLGIEVYDALEMAVQTEI